MLITAPKSRAHLHILTQRMQQKPETCFFGNKTESIVYKVFALVLNVVQTIVSIVVDVFRVKKEAIISSVDAFAACFIELKCINAIKRKCKLQQVHVKPNSQ